MLLALSRYLALVFAIALGIAEAALNWGNWQFAPFWIVDYVIVGWLLWSFFKTRSGQHVHLLLSGWAFTAGVFYMALFGGLDPENFASANKVLLVLIGLMLGLSAVGFLCALFTIHGQPCAAPTGRHR
jgi:hypothetical protein